MSYQVIGNHGGNETETLCPDITVLENALLAN